LFRTRCKINFVKKMHISILAITEQSDISTTVCMAGSYEIFTRAAAFWSQSGKPGTFKVQLVSASDLAGNGNEIFAPKPHCSINDIERTDLIIIPASQIREYEKTTPDNKLFIRWVEQQYKHGAEVASMCSGLFLLAATGLLDKKTCSTHWAVSDQFRAQHPGVNLKTDKLITDEGGIYTNGGAYSFLHLLLYLVEKYFDRQTAVFCAKIFQIDLDRNLQAEFSIFNGHKNHTDEMILNAQHYFEGNFSQKISIEATAAKYSVSRRNFDRRFIKATGLAPLDYLQRIRIEAAKKSFENTRKTVNEIMYDVGYNDPKAFREVFNRITGLSPLEYKSKYNIEGRLV